jgi:hypothetical protein
LSNNIIANSSGSLIRKKNEVEFLPLGKNKEIKTNKNDELRELGKLENLNSMC